MKYVNFSIYKMAYCLLPLWICNWTFYSIKDKTDTKTAFQPFFSPEICFSLAWQQTMRSHWLHFKLTTRAFHSRLKVDADGWPLTKLKHCGSSSWLGIKVIKTLTSVWIFSSTSSVLLLGKVTKISALTSHSAQASDFMILLALRMLHFIM